MHTLESLDFYSLFHPRWFESVDHYIPNPAYSNLFFKVFPSDWKLVRHGIWYGAQPAGAAYPPQGWKLHLSVRTADTLALLEVLFPILLQERVHFKFLIDSFMATLSNGKMWPRSGGGKFVTIYPATYEQFLSLGDRLCTALKTFEGPYILSDRRWPNSKCIFYRYGGFEATSVIQGNGIRTHVITAPNGELVPDERKPFWNPPAWVKDPFADAPPAAATGGASFANGRFSITGALQFSNRGGVYKGIDNQTGKTVVLKEARPKIEVGSQLSEAIHTLEKEYTILRRLAPTGFFVQPVDFFLAWEHAFLVEEYLPGMPLGQYSIVHNPIYSKNFQPAAIDTYFGEMRSLWLQLARAIAATHESGIILGDLSFSNLIIQDGRICICDLETATIEGTDRPIGLRTPGLFDAKYSEKANDYYALGVLMFGCMILSFGVVGIFPPSLPRFLKELSQDFDLPAGLTTIILQLVEEPEYCVAHPEAVISALEQLHFQIGATQHPRLGLPIQQQYTPEKLEGLRSETVRILTGITDYLLKTASPSRQDRLFPADMMVFETNPFSVSFGAAGVFHAVFALTGEVPQEWVRWILDHPRGLEDCPPGLYVGKSGIAWVLNEVGHAEEAREIVRRLRPQVHDWEDMGILYGAAGYGLACLRLWKDGGGGEFLADAWQIGKLLQATAQDHPQGMYWADREGKAALGYAHGGSGIALFLLYLSLATQDQAFYHLGRMALDFDLSYGKWLDGVFSGFPTHRIDPREESTQAPVLSCYWDLGSAGIGTTVLRYLAVQNDEDLEAWLPLLIEDASRKYTAFPQLFRGLAGLGNFMLDVWQYTGNPDHLLAAWQAAEGALLFQVERPEGFVFPGDQLRRESADFATGSAGIALFLHRLLHAEARNLPNFNFVLDDLLPNGRGLRVN